MCIRDSIKCDVSTICIGMAASMGAFLLSGGTKGKRLALPNAEIMIHQPSGGARGQETEIRIVAEEILKTRKKLNEILAANTGRTFEQLEVDTAVSYTHLDVYKRQLLKSLKEYTKQNMTI